MPTVVNMHEAKTHLSRLVAKVEAGGEVVIARDGKPVAKLVAAESNKTPRSKFGFGSMKGLIHIADDFDAPMTKAELALWYDAPFSTGDVPSKPARKRTKVKR